MAKELGLPAMAGTSALCRRARKGASRGEGERVRERGARASTFGGRRCTARRQTHVAVGLSNGGGAVDAWREHGHYAKQVVGTGVCALDPLFQHLRSIFGPRSNYGSCQGSPFLAPQTTLPLLLRVSRH